MNSRERTLAAINHRQPDRPPLYVSLTPQMARKLCLYHGLAYEPPIDAMESARISHVGLLTRLGVDVIAVAPTSPPSAPTITLPDGRSRNEWGMVFKEAGYYSELDEFPLSGASSESDIADYPFPDPLAEGRYESAKAMLDTYASSHGIIGDVETMFFEISWYLTGFEKFLTDLVTGSRIPASVDGQGHGLYNCSWLQASGNGCRHSLVRG